MLSPGDRLLLVLLASGALAAAPASALASPASAGARAAAPAASSTTADDLAADDDPAGDEATCDVGTSPGREAAGDAADDPSDDSADDPGDDATDPADDSGDDSADDPADDSADDSGDDDDASGIVQFSDTDDYDADDPADGSDDAAAEDCSAADEAPATTSSAPATRHREAAPTRLRVMSLERVLRTGHLTVGTVALSSGGAVTQTLRLTAATAPAALRPWRTAELMTGGRRSLDRARTVGVPLTLTKAGRSSLRKVGKEVRLTLRTTVSESGRRSTSTQVVVLRRTAGR